MSSAVEETLVLRQTGVGRTQESFANLSIPAQWQKQLPSQCDPQKGGLISVMVATVLKIFTDVRKGGK